MENEKFYCMPHGHMESLNDPEFYLQKMLNADSNGRDCVELNEEQMIVLSEAVKESNFKESEFIKNPSLKELELIATSDEHPGYVTNVVFKNTILPKTAVRHQVAPGITQTSIPMLDVYIYFNGHREPDVVAVIYINEFRENGIVRMSGTSQEPVFINAAIAEELLSAEDEGVSYLVLMLRDIKFTYMGIQYALRNRPEVFMERREPISNPIPHVNPAPAYRKVNARRKYVICEREFAEYRHTGRTMQCPCWGVMGHWRNYKSGKSVWIGPYRKGKERNNPSAYSPKNYLI